MINLIPKPAYVEERLGEFTVTRDSTKGVRIPFAGCRHQTGFDKVFGG